MRKLFLATRNTQFAAPARLRSIRVQLTRVRVTKGVSGRGVSEGDAAVAFLYSRQSKLVRIPQLHINRPQLMPLMQ